MVSRDEIILDVCECLVHQVNMKVHIIITKWQTFRLVAATAVFGFCLGGFLASFFGAILRGGILGSFIGAFLGSAVSVNLRVDEKRANEVIRNDLTSEQKSLLVEYVRIFFEGKHLIDTTNTLSMISDKKEQESAITRSVSIFFRNEMDYVVNYDMVGYPKTFYSDL